MWGAGKRHSEGGVDNRRSVLGQDKLGVGRSLKGLLGDKPGFGGPLQVTFGGSCSPQVVDGSQDEPAGFLLIGGDAQHLHGRL